MTLSNPVLITGGAGFIGTNLAHRFLQQGQPVVLLDNLSRAGVEQNVRWLRETHSRQVQLRVGDIRNRAVVASAVSRAAQVFHFAAQVAVTTSLTDPRSDYEVNTGGTFNLLECLRELESPPPLVFTSTNKVYGSLPDVRLRATRERFEPSDESLLRSGIDESRTLDFHTPYGCSKGAAEQYVLDYARSFHLPACVFRMSCIYGPHQFGTEDQGWVAHFLIRSLENKLITVYGDGRQVRDVLFVEDLVDAFLLAQQHMQRISGQAFNIGGGAQRTLSLLELLSAIEQMTGDRPRVAFEPLRPGDQRYYVSNTGKFQAATGWAPKVDPITGIRALFEWLLLTRDAAPEPVEAWR